VDKTSTRLAILGLLATAYFLYLMHRYLQAAVVLVATVLIVWAPRVKAEVDRVSHWFKSHGRATDAIVVRPVAAHGMGTAVQPSVELGWGPNEARADDVAGRFVHQLRRPIMTASVLNLPPPRTGPWRPGGHGPEPVGGSTCACGAIGITDWQAHIAEAATA